MCQPMLDTKTTETPTGSKGCAPFTNSKCQNYMSYIHNHTMSIHCLIWPCHPHHQSYTFSAFMRPPSKPTKAMACSLAMVSCAWDNSDFRRPTIVRKTSSSCQRKTGRIDLVNKCYIILFIGNLHRYTDQEHNAHKLSCGSSSLLSSKGRGNG